MNELTLDGKVYVSSKRAAEITGYAKDYVGQLCREGHVEARLVGRNWYVLETSIREHRFGKKESSNEFSGATKTTPEWEPSHYKTEVPAYIAPISEKAAIEAVREEAPQPQKGLILSDMQSAWQEWFTKKASEETEVSPEGEPAEEIQEVEPEPVHISAIEDEPSEEVAEEEVEMTPHSSIEPLDLTGAASSEEEYEKPQEVIMSPRRQSRVRNLVLQSIFVAIALVSVAITAIGTGFAMRYTAQYRLSEINFIAGVSTYNK